MAQSLHMVCWTNMLHGLRILVVDDEPLVCEMIAAMLAEDKHFPRTALSAVDAISKLQAETFDVVLTDYQMPDVKGDQLAAIMKGRFPFMPIILMTGRLLSRRPENIDLLLPKPFSLLQLRVALSDLDVSMGAMPFPRHHAEAA